ncbi:hypothetical protein P20652_0923 [Pseudoalteromonas sp. BSi20652]|nr:hypothetical protein P20652_0923 [Pseudoalteromonas sp. BSi20652]
MAVFRSSNILANYFKPLNEALYAKESILEIIKASLKMIGKGFLYGTGFALGVWFLFTFVLSNIRYPNSPIAAESESVMVANSTKVKSSKIKIISSKSISRPYLIDIIGTLKNTGDLSTSGVNLKADLFDENNNFIFQCETWLSDEIAPDQSLNFKVGCHGINEDIYKNFGSYKLKASR